MKVDVTTVGSFQKRLAFVVPPDQVANQLEQAYKRLATKVRLAGFRPGKAPRKVLEAKYATQVEADVANDIIQQSYRSALTDHAIGRSASRTWPSRRRWPIVRASSSRSRSTCGRRSRSRSGPGWTWSSRRST